MYLVEYNGAFGYIKPFSALRDIKTISQKFLTPSMIMGIERFINLKHGSIIAHRLNFENISEFQETTRPKNFDKRKGNSIIIRGVLTSPTLYLLFSDYESALTASKTHICLSRVEDIMFPVRIDSITEYDFNQINGYEFKEDKNGNIMVGYNRYRNNEKMIGNIIANI